MPDEPEWGIGPTPPAVSDETADLAEFRRRRFLAIQCVCLTVALVSALTSILTSLETARRLGPMRTQLARDAVVMRNEAQVMQQMRLANEFLVSRCDAVQE